MIHAITDMRTGERIEYSLWRTGRVGGRIVSNERMRLPPPQIPSTIFWMIAIMETVMKGWYKR